MTNMDEIHPGTFTVHKKNMTLRVKVSFVNAPIKATSRYKKGRIAQWPVLKLSDWIRMAFEEPCNGFFFVEAIVYMMNGALSQKCFKTFGTNMRMRIATLQSTPSTRFRSSFMGTRGVDSARDLSWLSASSL